jgi:ABC-type multidrug transport system permease subunit
VSGSGVLPVAQGVAWRTIKNVVTSPAILLPSLLFPLFMFTAFAGGLSQVQELPGFDFEDGYTAFQFVFVLLQSAAFGGVFTGFGIARDFEGGFARRLLLASPRRSGIVLGYALAAFLRWAIVALAVTAVALVAGMEVSGDPEELVAMYSLALLVNVCGFMWSAGIAMRFRSIQAGPLMQMPVFLLLFFAPVYVPLDLLTGTMHAVAVLNPITYVLEAGRSLISGQPEEIALAFLLAAALAGTLSLWAFRGLRRAEAAG